MIVIQAGGYNHYFLLKRHFEQDGTRQNAAFSDKQFEFYKDFFHTTFIKYTVLDKGSVKDKAWFINYMIS
jgi:hypothetical protein